jgi:hypothetical protein
MTAGDVTAGRVTGDVTVRADVADLMARMAAGDQAAVFCLVERHGTRLAGAVRAMARRRGVEWLHREDLDDLVVDAAMALLDVAEAWDPAGGALPWVWARHRLEAVVDRFVGQHHDSLDAERAASLERLMPEAPPPGPGCEPDVLDLLAHLGSGSELATVVRDALAQVGSRRDQRLLLEVRLQESLGDRSPAATVAPRYGMQPAAVRQQVRRMKHRLRRLAASEARFAPLADLPLVA